MADHKNNTQNTGNPVYPEFRRSPRLIMHRAQGKMEIEPAPGIGTRPEINWVSVLLPVFGMLIVSMIMMMVSSAASMVFTIPMMLIGVIGTVVNYRTQTKKYEEKEQLLKERYKEYIKDCEKQLKEAVSRQRKAAGYSNPTIEQCVRIAQEVDARLWERTRPDADFLSLPAGMGEEPLCVEIQTPKVGFVLEESDYIHMPGKLAEKYRIVDEVPVLCDLLRYPCVGVTGERETAIRLIWNLVIQAAALHGYDELKLVVLFPENEWKRWEWMRWLPHCFDDTRTMRFLACDRYKASGILAPLQEELTRRMERAGQTGASEMPSHLGVAAGRTDHEGNGSHLSGSESGNAPLPHYLFVVADPTLLQEQAIERLLLGSHPALGASCLFLSDMPSHLPRTVSLIMEANGKESRMYPRECADQVRRFRMEEASWETCDRFARSLAPIRLPEKGSAQLPSSVTFLEGYHVKKAEQLELGEYWAESCNYQSMAVPIGVRANGENFYFDIHEKAHGPHGVVGGMTGSGKTELVQSWILSMALQFSPQDVSFVLIDFKGTGLILPFLKLPHLAGTISDLDENISRNLIALKSELQRRKMLFDSAGVSKISDYLKLYRKGQVTEPLPYLFVVIDEYAEFKAKFPDFTNEVNTLFRTGRSMGVSILLLTQNPAGVVSGESDTNVRFRWCLKVASASASKELLGGHDNAAYITNPGRAYIRVGSDEVFEPIQSFYSGAPYEPERQETSASAHAVALVALDGTRKQKKSRNAAVGSKSQITEIDKIVRQIRDYTKRRHIPDARHIWQERMPGRIYLASLLKDEPPHEPGELLPIVGLIDDPANQRQRPFYLPLSAEGHAAIYGAPGSGKTTFLQTLAASLCMTYSPEEVNLFIMDFGGWSMGMFRDFPQVAGIANDNEEDGIQAIARTIDAILAERKELFSQLGVGSLRSYLRSSGKKLPYIVLLLDNFAPVYSLYPKLEDFFIRLGRNAGSYGVYLVTTAGNTMALGYKLNQNIKLSIALQLANSSDYSAIVGRTEGLFPDALPGRGLVRENGVLEFQTALPVQPKGRETVLTAMRALAEETAERWGETQAEAVTVMPKEITFGSVKVPEGQLALGLSVEQVSPVAFDAAKHHHLLVSGVSAGETANLLQSLARQMCAQGGWRIVLFAKPQEHERYQELAGMTMTGQESFDAAAGTPIKVVMKSGKEENHPENTHSDAETTESRVSKQDETGKRKKSKGENIGAANAEITGQDESAKRLDDSGASAEPAKLEILTDGAAADAFLEWLAAELTCRQELRKSDPDVPFAPICLMIDGYRTFFEAIAQQSVSRLRALVMLGKGLGVTLIAADDASKLSVLTQFREAVLLLLAKGPALLLGGKATEHMAVDLPVKATEKTLPLATDEGWYWDGENVTRLKRMRAEGEKPNG